VGWEKNGPNFLHSAIVIFLYLYQLEQGLNEQSNHRFLGPQLPLLERSAWLYFFSKYNTPLPSSAALELWVGHPVGKEVIPVKGLGELPRLFIQFCGSGLGCALVFGSKAKNEIKGEILFCLLDREKGYFFACFALQRK
jgi:hypothetical protein